MAPPTVYTENTLADYMHTILESVAQSMGYVSPGSYTEAVNDVMLAYGTDNLATVTGRTGIALLRALARREAWRKVMANTAGDYNYSADGATFNRSQVHELAEREFKTADSEVTRLSRGGRVARARLNYTHDPYIPHADGEQTLP